MGIKKIARPINKAKNDFVAWLKENNAENIDVYEGEGVESSERWDYYRSVSAFIGDSLYVVYFMIWEGKVNIDYRDEEVCHNKMSILEFTDLF